ncbi:MAG: hypothetical protein HGA22_06695, partial [Clostridiales bacterium]|nr:hypothetical protein [Clostridiales bacterium]
MKTIKIQKKNSSKGSKGATKTVAVKKAAIERKDPVVRRDEVKPDRGEHRSEISGILMLAFGLLLFLSFYVKNTTGLFGIFIRDVLLGILGFPALIIPFAVLAYGIYLIFKHSEHNLKFRLLHSFFLFILVSAIVQALLYNPEDYFNLKPLECIKQFYLNGAQMKGGGVCGGILSLPFLLVFQKIGAIIILTALTLVEIILVTNTSISNFVINLKSLFKRKKNETFEQDYEYFKGDRPQKAGSKKTAGQEPEFNEKPERKAKVIDFEIVRNNRDIFGEIPPEFHEPVHDAGFGGDAGFNIDEIKTPRQKKTPEESFTKIDKAAKTEKIKPASIEPLLQGHPANPYKRPPFDLLKANTDNGSNAKTYRNQVVEGAKKLEETLGNFGVSAKV